jgi:hypothetical protein
MVIPKGEAMTYLVLSASFAAYVFPSTFFQVKTSFFQNLEKKNPTICYIKNWVFRMSDISPKYILLFFSEIWDPAYSGH